MKVAQLAIFVLIISISSSCLKTKEAECSKSKEVIISGKVINQPNYLPKSMALVINDVASGEQIHLADDLDKSGNFEFRFKRYCPQEVMLKYYSLFNIFIHSGDSIHVVLDGDKMGSQEESLSALSFSGDAVKENQQIKEFESWFIPLRRKDQRSMIEESRLKPENYYLYRDSIRKEFHKKRTDFLKTHKVSSFVQSWFFYEIEHNFYHELTYYPRQHAILNNYKKDWQIPTSYYKYFEQNKLNPGFIYNAAFAKSFANEYFILHVWNKIEEELIEQGLVKDTIFPDGKKWNFWLTNIDSAKIDGIDRFTAKSKLQEIIYTQYFMRQLKQRTNTALYEKYSNLISAKIKHPFLKESLFKVYQETKKMMSDPDHQNKTNIGHLGTDSGSNLFKGILDKHKGKVIYIDCWAIWCISCIMEMPNTRKLIYEFKDAPVEFVFLCFNSPEEAARKKVDELKTGGTHYFLNQDQSNHLQKILSFSAFPNYFLINKNGEIVEKGASIKPGSEHTKEAILELIK